MLSLPVSMNGFKFHLKNETDHKAAETDSNSLWAGLMIANLYVVCGQTCAALILANAAC